jgi:hypothetical protein
MQTTFAITRPGGTPRGMSRVGTHASQDVPEHA